MYIIYVIAIMTGWSLAQLARSAKRHQRPGPKRKVATKKEQNRRVPQSAVHSKATAWPPSLWTASTLKPVLR